MMALNSQIAISLVAHESSVEDLSSTLRTTPVSYAAVLTDGTGENQAQVAWSDARTMSGSTESVNPSSLSDLRSGVTATVSMTAIKALYVKNTGSGSLSFAGGPFPAGGQTVSAGAVATQIDPSAGGMSASGITVAGAAGRSYEILLIGEGSVS